MNYFLRMGIIGVPFLMAALMAGCATDKYHWVNSSPAANFKIDEATCANEAVRVVPVTAAVPPAQRKNQDYYLPEQTYKTQCDQFGSRTTCTTQPNARIDTSIIEPVTNDAERAQQAAERQTAANQAKYEENCLVTKGWIYQKKQP